MLPQGDILVPAHVTGRKHDADGNPIGVANSNPLLDIRVYEVEFLDGHIKEYAANRIAESIYAEVDPEGNQFLLMDEITGHQKDENAIEKANQWIQIGSNRHRCKTTQGWKLKNLWRNGTTTWEWLRNLKESNPIKVAEYAIAQGIADEPAFAWWVPFVMKRRDLYVKAVGTRYQKRLHKFGIEVPMTVKRAYEIDKETGTDFWAKAIEKEMKHVCPAFEILVKGRSAPIGSKWIPCHMVFEVKMDFTQKARFVAGGHWTAPLASLTYSSVVARDSVRLCFLIAALNDLDLLAADIGNAYLNADTRVRVHTTCGPEFGGDQGKITIIRKALYGLKSSGAAWRSHLASTLHDMQFKASLADPDVWMRPAVKASGENYYEYIFVYVDDILVVSEKPAVTMDTIGKAYRLKEGSVGPPTQYLGVQIKPHRFDDMPGSVFWSMGSARYVKEAVHNVEIELKKVCKTLPSSRITSPLAHGYRPELDMSPLLDAAHTNFNQQQIGILCWAVELGCIDLHCSVALMAQYLVAPRQGHLNQVYHMFAYLKAHDRSRIVLDASWPKVDESRFHQADWHEFYRDVQEAIPPNAPESRGNSVIMSCFCDADHAGNKVFRRSHTGILIFVNRAPIIWFLKRQNTVETSTFGSEFVAARIAVELIEGLRYQLHMFGVPIDGPTNMYIDNESVVLNSTHPESALKKKHNAIAYHRVREAVAAGTIRIAYECSETNLADLLTKLMPGSKMKELCRRILH
jgi:hypothetical protein